MDSLQVENVLICFAPYSTVSRLCMYLSTNIDFQMTFLGILLQPERGQNEMFYYSITFSMLSLLFFLILLFICILFY